MVLCLSIFVHVLGYVVRLHCFLCMGQHSPESSDDLKKKATISVKIYGIMCIALLRRKNPLHVA